MAASNGLDQEVPSWPEWFKGLLHKLRKEYLALSPEERQAVVVGAAQGQHQTTPVFSAPAHLLVVWVHDPVRDRDVQLLLLTRGGDEPDGVVRIVGPITLDEFENQTSGVLAEQRWKQEWRPGIPLSAVVEDRLVETAMMAGEHFGRDQSPYAGGAAKSWGDFGIYMLAPGEIRKFNESTLVRELFSLFLPSGAAPVPQPQAPLTLAFGVYLQQPLWFGDQPIPSYGQRLAGYRLPPGYADRAWSYPYGGTQAIAWRDGLLAVIANRIEEALPLLNAFMAAGLLLGLRVTAVTKRDVVELMLRSSTTDLISTGTGLYSPTAKMVRDRWASTSPPVQRHGVLTEPELQRVVRFADAIWASTRVRELALFQLLSQTFVEVQEDPTGAFLFAWSINEQDIYTRADALATTTARKRKLARYSVDAVLELLLVGGNITQNEYAQLSKWKEMRNQAIHGARSVSHSDAIGCMTRSRQVVRALAVIQPADDVHVVPLTWPP